MSFGRGGERRRRRRRGADPAALQTRLIPRASHFPLTSGAGRSCKKLMGKLRVHLRSKALRRDKGLEHILQKGKMTRGGESG